ncbi:hypothetical protein [Actinoplanes solisilvae]|uniref:hypothetical protein n=1 Tax=Actinoplanes solisilvae TaxID=2486853 RepID=UPI000FDA2AE4|nr:hypothetical protein [Actinoplanes solisilvae]
MKRRWWLTGLVSVWIAVVAVLAVWSVGHERATVPEQRDLDLAVTDLQRASGVVYAAASGAGRAVLLGPVEFSDACRVTPVRSGLVAARTVTIYVPSGQGVEVVKDIAARLPGGYQADIGVTHAGTRVSLFADAGDFIAVELSGASAATAFSLQVSTGCRPLGGDSRPSGADPSAPAPALLSSLVNGPGQKHASTVTCPSGGVAGSWTVDGVTAPQVGEKPLVADETVRAYRRGADSVIVRPEGGRARVTVSTPCQ